jgi:type I restriction enzyme S subunit
MHQYRLLVRAETTFDRRVTKEDFRELPLALPPVEAQRAIADYLDTETARIDALITKKQRMLAVIAERGELAFASALERRCVPWPRSLEELEEASSQSSCRVIHLSQCLDQLTNGYVGPTRDILEKDGIRYVQSLHIKSGQIDFSRRPFYVNPKWHAERPRIHLREDDVLIVQTGDIGQVAVVPSGFGEASCHALQIARVRRSMILGPYLAEYLRSSLGYQSLLSRATGALHPHLEGGVRNVPVIVPSMEVQREVVSEVADNRRHAATVSDRLGRQILLLREHRQALITAAVTGELEVPGVVA